MSPDGRRMVFGGRARFTQVDATISAPILYRYMTDRFPQLRGFQVTHAWTGNVAFTLDALPHMGERDGLHYCLGCNGSGVAMMTYLGWQTARKIARAANYACSFGWARISRPSALFRQPVVFADRRRLLSVTRPARPLDGSAMKNGASGAGSASPASAAR